MAYSHRDTFQSRPIVHYHFTYATILSDIHICDTGQFLGNRRGTLTFDDVRYSTEKFDRNRKTTFVHT